jgi:hypothetical protein
MKTKIILFLFLMLTMLVQVACAPVTNGCPTATSDTKLLTNIEDGYCLLYPAEASAKEPGWVVFNPTSGLSDVPGEAWLNIQVQDAEGQTVQDAVGIFVAQQSAHEIMNSEGSGFTGLNINIKEVQVDGIPAFVIDGLPGLDSNRIVVLVQNDHLYTLTFMPWHPNVVNPTPLENVYTMVMDTLHFLPQE